MRLLRIAARLRERLSRRADLVGLGFVCLGVWAAAFALSHRSSGHDAPAPRRIATVIRPLEAVRAPEPLADVMVGVPMPGAVPVSLAADPGPSFYPAWRWPGSLGYLPSLSLPGAALGAWIGGIDYSDPVGNGTVPLVKVAGRWDEPLSGGFRVRDFASPDGAAYARISDVLVAALEHLRTRAGGMIVISGYRHQAYNELIEGSAAGSQHIAGRAADVWSGTKTPLELAGLALETLGCHVGLGLGANTLHVDLRGYLASWTYPGAALDEPAFDAWVGTRCGVVPADERDESAAPAPADSTSAAPDSTLRPPPPDAARMPAKPARTDSTSPPGSRV